MLLQYIKFLVFVLIIHSSFGQEKSIQYFDASWEETDRANASFYRDLPLQEKDGRALLKDYYMSGKPQFTGWIKKDDENYYYDEVTWFYENGNPEAIRNYKNGSLDGESKTFYEDGTAETIINYKNGKKEGKRISYKEDGSIRYERSYKNNKPYDGIFFRTRSDIKYTSIYKEGIQTEEEAKYSGKIIAKGSYINGEPHDGSFISEEKIYECYCNKFYTLKNGKEEGKQVYKRMDDAEPYAYYYTKNGIKEGESYIYDEKDERRYILQYKNGKPYEGELLEENRNIIVYKKGSVERTKKRIKKEKKEFLEVYKEDKKIGVEFSFFEINGKVEHKGVYKNEEPYQGYFLKESKEGKFGFPILDYYENGEKIYQYAKGHHAVDTISIDFVTIPFKSIYKDNEIYTGAKYYHENQNVFVTEILKKGKIEAISLWVFAMHYANNLRIKRIKKGVVLQEMRSPNLRLKVDKEYISILYKDSLLIDQRQRKVGNDKNKTVKYYIENNILKYNTSWEFSEKAYAILKANDIENQFEKSDFLKEMYRIIPVENTIDYLLNNFPNESQKQGFLTLIRYNELGVPSEGFLITQNKNKNVFDVEVYFKNKFKESKNNLTEDELRSYIKMASVYFK